MSAVTKRVARQYLAAPKKDKGRLLDELVAVTGWSRGNARQFANASRLAVFSEGGLTPTSVCRS